MFKNVLLVGLGSGIGGALRYLAFTILHEGRQVGFPLKTIIVNVLGCLIFGIVTGLAGSDPNNRGRLFEFLTIGICGGFTTFSTFAGDNMKMLCNGQLMDSFIYTMLSLVLCVVFCFIGNRIAIH
jgi:Integral membrane protein possibly involved in chromosome condensation